MQPHSTLRRHQPDAEVRALTKPASEDEPSSLVGRRIVCAACGHPITTDAQRIEMNGRHDHRCVNPDGVIFRIGCFQRAPGCVTHGVPTTAFTWFPGSGWNYALCNGCSTLLGWKYHEPGAASFLGLILNRLAAERERSH